MVCWWKKLISVIIIFFKMTSSVQCYCKSLTALYFSVYYAELGKPFLLDVKAYHLSYTWLKNDKPLAVKTCNYESQSTKPRIYSCNGDPDLIFQKTKPEDNGKYILELSCPERKVYSFEIIVQAKPFVFIDCTDMTVNESDNITCICKAADVTHSAKVAWIWNQAEQGNSGMEDLTDVLLRNLSANQSGTYTCLAESRNLVNRASFNLQIMPKTSTNSTVEIKYFKVFQEVRASYNELSLPCKAEGFPELKYTILHNRTAVTFGDMYTVDAGKVSSLGQYKCLARYGASSVSRFLFLNASFFVKPCLEKHKRKAQTEWKVGLILGAFSILAGILVLPVLMCSWKKCEQKNDRSENAENVDVYPPRAQGGLVPAIENVEMRLRHATDSPGDEEIRHRNDYDLHR